MSIMDTTMFERDKPLNILLVDDKQENLLALESLLKAPQVVFHKARTGVEALELLLLHEFALAILDVQMPEMDGLELAELMRGPAQTRSVPIIFVTAGSHSRARTFQGYEKGAVDFLHKPLDPHVVKSKVQVFLDLARQRQQLHVQLRETQRLLLERDQALIEVREALQTRDEFMSIASHELKTPLTSLHLQIQMMNRVLGKEIVAGKGLEGPVQIGATSLKRFSHGLEVCGKQSLKLTSLLDELLDLTRVRLGKLQLSMGAVDLVALTREVIERFRVEYRQQGELISVEAPIDAIGEWDKTRIDQVVTNLVSNAIKYGEGKPVRITIDCEAGRARFTIEDEGIGIPAELQDKIFERFERAVSGQKFSGLGLGLYISRQIIEAHGGKISVESLPKHGSKFSFFVPLRQVAPDAEVNQEQAR